MIYRVGGLDLVGKPTSSSIAGLPGLDYTSTPGFRVTCGGSANALTLTTGLELASTLPVGLELRFRANVANTAAATIAVDNGPAQACVTVTGSVLPSSYIRADADTIARWNGSHWILSRDNELVNGAANGIAERFSTGVMRVFATVTLTYNSPANLRATWNYPASFITPPAISFTIGNPTSATPMVGQYSAPMALPYVANASLRQYRIDGGTNFGTDDTLPVYAIASGLWYQ